MSVHSDGLGSGWDIVETLDVDQPHGLDYRQLNHLAIALRKRINKEHVAFGDTTAGGEHIPGGCAVLDIVDGTDDVTTAWGAGTYTGGGLAYSLCGIMYVCSTLDTTYDGAKDVTIVKLHPDLQWAGQDVTWAGAHQFDVSVDVQGAMDASTLNISGPVDIINADVLRLRTTKTPAAAGAAGNAGDICWDANFVYVCVAGNTWRRAAIAAW